MLNFNDWALVISLGVGVLAIPLFLLLRVNRTVPPLLGYLVLLLALGGAVGAVGRLVDKDLVLDYWIRIFIIATRLAALGAMLYDIKWLLDRRKDL